MKKYFGKLGFGKLDTFGRKFVEQFHGGETGARKILEIYNNMRTVNVCRGKRRCGYSF